MWRNVCCFPKEAARKKCVIEHGCYLYASHTFVDAKYDRAKLLDYIKDINDEDMDMMCDEQLWNDTKNEGFASNIDYLGHHAQDIEDDEKYVKIIVDNWIHQRPDYYLDYWLDITVDEDSDKITDIFFTAIIKASDEMKGAVSHESNV